MSSPNIMAGQEMKSVCVAAVLVLALAASIGCREKAPPPQVKAKAENVATPEPPANKTPIIKADVIAPDEAVPVSPVGSEQRSRVGKLGEAIDFETIEVTPLKAAIVDTKARPTFGEPRLVHGVLEIQYRVKNKTAGQVFDLHGFVTAVDEFGNASNYDNNHHFIDNTYFKDFLPGQEVDMKSFVKLKNPKAKKITAKVLCDKNNQEGNAEWVMIIEVP